MLDLVMEATRLVMQFGVLTFAVFVYLSENYFALALICLAVVGSYTEGRASAYRGPETVGAVALVLFLLHAGWLSSGMSYTAFVGMWVAPIIVVSLIGYLAGVAVRRRRARRS